MKIGILTSGGDCQGLNAAIRGVAKALYNEFGSNVTIYGIRDGKTGASVILGRIERCDCAAAVFKHVFF